MSEKRTPAHKLCYRCGGWFSTLRVNPNTPLSEFEKHDAECLERCRQAAARKQPEALP